jgi:hypothetical protein
MFPTHAIVMLEKRKNDQCGKGSEIWISALPQKFCPIKLLKKFAQSQCKHYAKLSEESFLFRATKKYSTTLTYHKLTYGQATKQFKAMIATVTIAHNSPCTPCV